MRVKKTQAETIRDHLNERGSITQMEAAGLYCITDLAGRVRDIRNAHYDSRPEFPFDVVSEHRAAPNGTRYVRYWKEEAFALTGKPSAMVANGSGCYMEAL